MDSQEKQIGWIIRKKKKIGIYAERIKYYYDKSNHTYYILKYDVYNEKKK